MIKKTYSRNVKPKKFLGQHFLKDLQIAEDIVNGLSGHMEYKNILEIGPGMGILTDFLIKGSYKVNVIEIDRESVLYLKKKFEPELLHIIEHDFLKYDLNKLPSPIGLIGNFPYNISSQIFFRVLEFKNHIPEVVCMLQKEVAQRLCSSHGSSDHGILSVFLQAYYTTEYLFTVDEHVFDPPPKVKSGVIRIKRNERQQLGCDEIEFRKLVKLSFNMKRKTLRNALKILNLPASITEADLFNKRAEQLSVDDFIFLTNQIQQN